jgi:O6-methylguanine-DNA--protein-cysteine methyltransferase
VAQNKLRSTSHGKMMSRKEKAQKAKEEKKAAAVAKATNKV